MARARARAETPLATSRARRSGIGRQRRFRKPSAPQLIFTRLPLIVLIPDASTFTIAPFVMFLADASEVMFIAFSSIFCMASMVIALPLIVIVPSFFMLNDDWPHV